MHYEELTVSGGSNAMRADVHDAVAMLAGGLLDETAIVTHTFGLDQWREAVEAAREHVGVKIAINRGGRRWDDRAPWPRGRYWPRPVRGAQEAGR